MKKKITTPKNKTQKSQILRYIISVLLILNVIFFSACKHKDQTPEHKHTIQIIAIYIYGSNNFEATLTHIQIAQGNSYAEEEYWRMDNANYYSEKNNTLKWGYLTSKTYSYNTNELNIFVSIGFNLNNKHYSFNEKTTMYLKKENNKSKGYFIDKNNESDRFQLHTENSIGENLYIQFVFNT